MDVERELAAIRGSHPESVGSVAARYGEWRAIARDDDGSRDEVLAGSGVLISGGQGGVSVKSTNDEILCDFRYDDQPAPSGGDDHKGGDDRALTDFTDVAGYQPTYTDVLALRDAAMAAGMVCYGNTPRYSDGMPGSMDCTGSSILTVWASPEEKARTRANVTGEMVEDRLRLEGENWTIGSTPEEIRMLAPILGARINVVRSYEYGQ